MSSAGQIAVSHAGGKINLYLKVVARRMDGYHELNTLFWPLREPSDKVSVDFAAKKFAVECDDADLPVDADNLAGRAALLFAARAGIAPDWRISLGKNIPVAAGMGGGSADAAAVLTLLNAHYEIFSAAELAVMALTLGADVPFFLNPRAGFAGGVGELLEPFDFPLPELPVLLVNPLFPVSAKWAFTNLAKENIGADLSGAPELLAAAMRRGDIGAVAGALHNDLAPALYAKFPLLTMLRRDLLECGALNAEITGSGPTLYGIFADRGAAQAAMERLTAIHGGAIMLKLGF